jgi:hypothetical protein
MNANYLDAVRLLLAFATAVFRNPLFALKGGTAINLFVRNMPRLLVDLDLVIADHKTNRDEILAIDFLPKPLNVHLSATPVGPASVPCRWAEFRVASRPELQRLPPARNQRRS